MPSMTIALSVKVHDGVVLASDSASTLQAVMDGQVGVLDVYNNANKIVNLHKRLPLGVVTWGAGAIGPRSLTTIFKDFRSMLTGKRPGPGGEDWKLDRHSYTVKEVAEHLRTYIHEHLYMHAFNDWPEPPFLGFLVAGYSSDSGLAEEYQVDMQGETCPEPQLVRPLDVCGLTANGQPGPISRLVFGVDPALPGVFQDALGVPLPQAMDATRVIQERVQYSILQDAMPIQDAIDLAAFLVDLTIKTIRFKPGPATVGGPVEVAAITKHEGFKWIQRKHYYDESLNRRATR